MLSTSIGRIRGFTAVNALVKFTTTNVNTIHIWIAGASNGRYDPRVARILSVVLQLTVGWKNSGLSCRHPQELVSCDREVYPDIQHRLVQLSQRRGALLQPTMVNFSPLLNS